MKKFLSAAVLSTALFVSAFSASAQKKIDQGTLVYTMDYVLTPAQKQQIPAGALPKESTIQFNGPVSHTEIQQGPATVGVTTNHALKQGIVLVDVPVIQKQYAVKLTKEDMDKQMPSPPASGLTETGETQTIASFKARKYTYKDAEGNQQEVWATTDIAIPDLGTSQMFPTLKGVPVKYRANQRGIAVVFTLKSLTAEKAGPFELKVPDGYEVKTMEELMEMSQGH